MSRPGAAVSWPTQPLAAIAGREGCFTDGDWIESKDQNPEGGVRLIQLADVGVGSFLDRSDRWLTHETAKRLNCTFLKAGDILIARMPDPVGRACIFPGLSVPCVTVVDVTVLRVPDSVNRRWLVEAINSSGFNKQVVAQLGGTTRSRISRTNLGAIPVNVPPRAVQDAIGALAQQFDRTCTGISTLLCLKRELKRGLMQELLTGKRRFPEFGVPTGAGLPAGWRRVRLGDVTVESSIRNEGAMGADRAMGVFKGVGLEPMREHVRADDLTRYKVVPPDAFAYNPMRLNIGSIARSRFDEDCLVSPDYVVFETVREALLPAYLDQFRHSTLWSAFVRPAGAGSVRVRIYYRDLAAMRIPLPPLEEQVRIAGALDTADCEIEFLQNLQAANLELKRGLMQQLLSGELALPEPPDAEEIPDA